MIHYNLKNMEFGKAGWTDLYIVQTADMTTTVVNGGALTLKAHVAGDLIQGAFVEIPTLITGPSAAPTAQVKAGSVAITPTVAIKTANYAVTDNTVVGATTFTGAGNLTLTFAAGGGDGAAATAGEIWVWVKKSIAAERTSIQVE